MKLSVLALPSLSARLTGVRLKGFCFISLFLNLDGIHHPGFMHTIQKVTVKFRRVYFINYSTYWGEKKRILKLW